MKNVVKIIEGLQDGKELKDCLKGYEASKNIIMGIATNQECSEMFFKKYRNDLKGFNDASEIESFVYYNIYNKKEYRDL